MNTATASIEQQARITSVSGNVQLVRDGFYLPVQVGMALLPGDRLVSDLSAKAVVVFTGVKDALVLEKGGAATFNLEVVELDQAPQWIATNLQGEGVYFDSQQAAANQATAQTDATNETGLFGLFGTTGAAETTGYPVLESLVFLGATAAIYSDNEDNINSTQNTGSTGNSGTSESGSNTNPGSGTNTGTGTSTPMPTTPEPETTANPLAEALAPVSDLLEGLLGSFGGAGTPPLGSQTAPLQNSALADTLNPANPFRDLL